MIDALFGSKTRVKLLHLFLNNPDKSYYVREITRLVDEQINSVRRELSNMLGVGIITSDTSDNKLYYKANQKHEDYAALRAIFANEALVPAKSTTSGDHKSGGAHTKGQSDKGWRAMVKELPGVKVAIAAGSLVTGSSARVDLLIVTDSPTQELKKAVQRIEKNEGHDLNYSILPFEEFYYRYSIRDKFITEILNNTHMVVVDTDNVLKG